MTHHGHHHDADPAGRAPNVANETAAEEALNSPQAVENENYVRQVLNSYIENKRKQDDSNTELITKLGYLKAKFPHFSAQFAEVEETAGLHKQ